MKTTNLINQNLSNLKYHKKFHQIKISQKINHKIKINKITIKNY